MESEKEQVKHQKSRKAKKMNQPNTYEEVMANMVTEIEEGNESALQAFLSFRNIEKVAKDCMKQIEHLALEELSDHNGRLEQGDVVIEARSSAGRWKFTDDAHAALKQQLKDAEELRKQAHKLHLKGSEVIDPETGEIVPPADYTPGKETIFISKARKS
jgi:aspartyl-tRNA synthetase